MRASTLLTGLLLVAMPAAAWAYHPLITDDTGTQGDRGNQLEFSFNRDRAEQAGITNTVRVMPVTYSRGLGETLDVIVSFNHTRLSSNTPGTDASGSGNPSLALKWRFYENEASKTGFGVKPEILLPIDDDKESAGLGNGRSSYGLTAILTQETAFGEVHVNLAARRARFRDTTTNPDSSVFHASIAPVWQVNEQWKLAINLGSETERAAGIRSRADFFQVGGVFSPSKDLDFAIGFLRRTDHTGPDTITNAITAGVTWRFE